MNCVSRKDSAPLVCICIPTYNAARTVRETLESILAQTYSNLIIHISDNASTDDTLKVVESFHDVRIHIHPQQENIGGEGNFTRCIQLAEGEYTAIFHADDVYESTIIEKQVHFLEGNNDVGSVFTEAFTIDERGKRLGTIGQIPEKGYVNKSIKFEELLRMMLHYRNFLVCPSVLVRTNIYKEHIQTWSGSFYQSASDIDMWLRLSQIQSIVVLNEPLMNYRISSAQFSERIRNRTERTDFFLVMDDYLKKEDVKSFLTVKDLRYYGWLERHESVACAINLLKLGRENEAKVLLKDIFCWDAVYAACSTKLGILTFLAGVGLRLLIMLGLAVLVSDPYKK